jgi:hypothetical protein
MPAPIAYRYVLDETKRRTVVALVANGSSRRVAARYIGCATNTITRTASRVPEFAAQLARAEQLSELNLLRNIQAAAKRPRHWRAAAWLLERRNPDDFAPRSPNVLTDQQVAEMIAQMIEVLHQDASEETYARAMQKLDQLLAECKSAGEPIVVEPRDDAFDDDEPFDDDLNDDQSDQNVDDSSPTPDPSHFPYGTNHLEVEIDLRTENQDATHEPATTFVNTNRPSQKNAS